MCGISKTIKTSNIITHNSQLTLGIRYIVANIFQNLRAHNRRWREDQRGPVSKSSISVTIQNETLVRMPYFLTTIGPVTSQSNNIFSWTTLYFAAPSIVTIPTA
jgi:hypothetical protein